MRCCKNNTQKKPPKRPPGDRKGQELSRRLWLATNLHLVDAVMPASAANDERASAWKHPPQPSLPKCTQVILPSQYILGRVQKQSASPLRIKKLVTTQMVGLAQLELGSEHLGRHALARRQKQRGVRVHVTQLCPTFPEQWLSSPLFSATNDHTHT